MARFSVYQNPSSATRDSIPFLLDVQSDLLDAVSTRVVVPLVRREEISAAAKGLNPEFVIQGIATVMLTEQLAGVPRSALGELVARVDDERGAILAALDLLFTGI